MPLLDVVVIVPSILLIGLILAYFGPPLADRLFMWLNRGQP